MRQAIQNISRVVGPNKRSIDLAQRMVRLTDAERSSRYAHHYRYRAMLRIAEGVPLIDDPVNEPAVDSLLDFHARIKGMDYDDVTYLHGIGKGFSAELGHVDQLGDWDAAHALDEEMRELPESPALADAGLSFHDTYGSRENAKISYNFRITDDPTGKGACLMGIRKRAAADIDTPDEGHTFDIVKRSSFFIDASTLPYEEQELLNEFFSQIKAKESSYTPQELVELNEARRLAGTEIIEPYLADRELRARSESVFAISSLYFALKRY